MLSEAGYEEAPSGGSALTPRFNKKKKKPGSVTDIRRLHTICKGLAAPVHQLQESCVTLCGVFLVSSSAFSLQFISRSEMFGTGATLKFLFERSRNRTLCEILITQDGKCVFKLLHGQKTRPAPPPPPLHFLFFFYGAIG